MLNAETVLMQNVKEIVLFNVNWSQLGHSMSCKIVFFFFAFKSPERKATCNRAVNKVITDGHFNFLQGCVDLCGLSYSLDHP